MACKVDILFAIKDPQFTLTTFAIKPPTGDIKQCVSGYTFKAFSVCVFQRFVEI